MIKIFPVCIGERYLVATKANKRKSKTFYYTQISFKGVEFVLDEEKAHSCLLIENSEFLANKYLIERIRELGFVLREF